MHCVGVPLHKYIKRVYIYIHIYIYIHVYIYMCIFLIYESIATRAFVGSERVLNRKERYKVEEYIHVKIYLNSTEVLFQKMH